MRVVNTAAQPKTAKDAGSQQQGLVMEPAAPAQAAAVQAQPERRPESDAAPAVARRHEAALAAMEAVLRRPTPQYPNGHSDAQIRAAQALARGRWLNDRVYVGKILEHGHARFQFKPDGAPSYFIRVQGLSGDKVLLWGTDFERAVGEANPLPNEDVVIHYKGAQKVDVPVVVTKPGGQKHVMFERVDRNTWEISSVRRISPNHEQEAPRRAENSRGPNIRLGDVSVVTQQPIPIVAARPARLR